MNLRTGNLFILFTLRVTLPCTPGYHSDPTGFVCIPCEMGTYSNVYNVNSSFTSCFSCIPGTYLPTSGSNSSSKCIACPVASYSSVAGASSQSQCLPCPIGTFSNQSGSSSLLTCLNCPVGSYSNKVAQTACIFCWPGSYSTAVGANSNTTCVSCPVGTYSTVIGSNSSLNCLNCSYGKYSNQMFATSSNACLLCQQVSPDYTSLLSCNQSVVTFGDTIICNSYPQLNGQPLYFNGLTYAPGKFSSTGNSTVTALLAASVSFSPVTAIASAVVPALSSQCPLNSSAFSFTVTIAPFSPLVNSQMQLLNLLIPNAQFFFYGLSIIDGISGTPTTLTLLWPPDDTTYVQCATSVIYSFSVDAIKCTIYPQRLGILSPTVVSQFSLSIIEGSQFGIFSPLMPIASNYSDPATAFNFNLTLNAPVFVNLTTSIRLFHGVMLASGNSTSYGGAFRLIVNAPPDRTSFLKCQPAFIAPGGSTICVMIPKSNGVPFFFNSSFLNLIAVPGILNVAFVNNSAFFPYSWYFNVSMGQVNLATTKIAYAYPNVWLDERLSGVSFVLLLASWAPDVYANVNLTAIVNCTTMLVNSTNQNDTSLLLPKYSLVNVTTCQNISYGLISAIPQATIYIPLAPRFLGQSTFVESRFFNLSVPNQGGAAGIPVTLSDLIVLNYTLGENVGVFDVMLTNLITMKNLTLFKLNVVITMDNTSSIICPSWVWVNSAITCQVIPRRLNQLVDPSLSYWNFTTWALAPTQLTFNNPNSIVYSYNNLPGLPYYIGTNVTKYGQFGVPSATHGAFNVTYYTNAVSGMILLNNGYSNPAIIAIYDFPDYTDISIVAKNE